MSPLREDAPTLLGGLLPVPRFATPLPGPGALLAPGSAVVAPPDPALAPVVERLVARLGRAVGGHVAVHRPEALHAHPALGRRPGRPADVHLVLDAGAEAAHRTGPEADETSTLTVSNRAVVLTAATPAGLRHATTTLLHLVERPDPWHRPRPVELPALRIEDGPRYGWRGLHLDVARHFQPVPRVLEVLEVMADLKLNRLHLHLTDDQGWRVALASRPLLAARSAGTEVGGGPGGCYSADDLRRLDAAAAALGVVLVPEIDVPGHVGAATHAYGELVPSGEPTPAYTGIDVGFSRLYADLPATESFLRDVLGEVASLVSGPWLHVGGDEALELGSAEYLRLVGSALAATTAAGKTPIGWQELARADLPPGTLVQLWDERESAEHVVAAARRGARVILSPASRTYLDMKYDPTFPIGLEWAGHVPLRQAYEWDPDTVLDLPRRSLAGVEACLWTETVATRDDLTALLLPRLAATAEVAWSPQQARTWEGFRERLASYAPRWTVADLAWTRTPDVPW